MNRILTFTLFLAFTVFVVLNVPPATAAAPSRGEMIEMKSLAFDRQLIAEDIAHYSFTLRVGRGEFEEIRIHRVVRERRPYVPVRTSRAIFLAHGDAWGFQATFLSSLATPDIPDQQALPIFLAEQDIDVWGIDFRWSLVPGDVSDLSFMADWGLGTDVDDLETALAVARSVRLVTGNGFAKFLLLGWSRGGQIGYAHLSAETQQPEILRHVRGFVTMDVDFKTDNETIRQANCASYVAFQEQISGGALVSEFAVVAEIGDLAADTPEEPSPFLPSVSNADLAELIGVDTNPNGAIPHFHSVGGVIDPQTLETDLFYTQPEHWFAFLSGVSPFQPLQINLEGAAVVCDEIDSPYDDHLAAIDVPVFYVGAAGAYGENGIYTTTLLGSSDVTTLIINEASLPEQDYGHSDLFLSSDAEALVWQPILDWIETR